MYLYQYSCRIMSSSLTNNQEATTPTFLIATPQRRAVQYWIFIPVILYTVIHQYLLAIIPAILYNILYNLV